MRLKSYDSIGQQLVMVLDFVGCRVYLPSIAGLLGYASASPRSPPVSRARWEIHRCSSRYTIALENNWYMWNGVNLVGGWKNRAVSTWCTLWGSSRKKLHRGQSQNTREFVFSDSTLFARPERMGIPHDEIWPWRRLCWKDFAC